MSQIESDKKIPTVDVLIQLAGVLEVNPAVFFVDDEVHVFDMKKLKSKYKKVKDLNDTLYRALDDVIRYARAIGYFN